jgi:hypothetical protein
MSRVQKFFKIFGWALSFALVYLAASICIFATLEFLRTTFGFVEAVVVFVLMFCVAVAAIGSAAK